MDVSDGYLVNKAHVSDTDSYANRITAYVTKELGS